MVDNEIIQIFLESQTRLVTQSSDLSLDSVASMVEEDAIDVTPGYQRRERWNSDKESALIESFILNIPVPPIYLAEDEYGRYSVIDGKQRVTAIHKFMKQGMKLKNLERFTLLEGKRLDELPSQLRNALTIRPYLRVVTLLKQSDPNLKYEVFTRLNTGGDNLLAQEIRNVAFIGPLNDLIFELSANEFLRNQLKISTLKEKAYKEMFDAEYVLRFFTLRESWENFPGNMNFAMNEFMDRHRQASDGELNNLRQLFNLTIATCQEIWGENAFHRPDGDAYRKQILQGFYDAQMVPISFYIEQGTEISPVQAQNIRQAFNHRYIQDAQFHDALRQFTSNSQRVHYRIETMNQILAAIL